jgi:FK506-binding nuclear protein
LTTAAVLHYGLTQVLIGSFCLLQHYQQTLDFTVAENERVFFKVTGTHTIYLTGNYLLPLDDEEDEGSEDGEEYDLSPDEDELDLDLMDEDDESDILDDLENPRISEIASDEEEQEAPAVSKKDKKGKNKRPAEDSGDDATLDGMMSKAKKPAEAATNGEQKLSKKQLKKLKKNNGEAADVTAEKKEDKEAKEAKKPAKEAKTDKKVQFAKNLEQGPTPSPPQGKAAGKDAAAGKLGVREVQGVTVDDRKLGSGRTAKKGDRVSMRYIGKLDNGKVFDCM